MIKVTLYSAKGIKKPSLTLPRSFEVKASKHLLAQAIRVYDDRLHPGLAKTKTRGEVALSTRKIYRQKGTGGARHGARSAPIFVGGGSAHGPKGVKRQLKLSKKIIKKALYLALSLKAKEGKLFFVDNVSSLKKTKEAASLINKIIRPEKEVAEDVRVTFVLSDKNKEAGLALRNISNIEVAFFSNLNAHKVFYGGFLLLDKEVLEESTNEKPRAKK